MVYPQGPGKIMVMENTMKVLQSEVLEVVKDHLYSYPFTQDCP